MTAARANREAAASRTSATLPANGTRRTAGGAAPRREMAAGADGGRGGTVGVWRGWALPHQAATEASPEGKLRIASTAKGRGLYGHL